MENVNCSQLNSTLIMLIGIIREGKIPADSRVALTPAQCKWLHSNRKDVKVLVESSASRCYSDAEYLRAGVEITSDLSQCDILMGIKEVPVEQLIPNKTYLFFSHTRKLQPYNQKLLQAIVKKNISLIDYECLEHDDGARIIGFGFFAGIVGAHNGMYAYGKRTEAYNLPRIDPAKSFQQLIHTYFGLKVPPIKIAVTGSGRVAHGILEIMNLLGIHEVEPDDFKKETFTYPVYVQLKGNNLYNRKDGQPYKRKDFHNNPREYDCLFKNYLSHTDVLLNGIYWEKGIDRLFENEDLAKPDFKIKTIADITDDLHGSVPCNLGDSTIENPVYGVDKITIEKTAPYLPGSIDIMAIGNLPNELPRDASRYFGEQLIKHVLLDIINGDSKMIERATIVKDGALTEDFSYMQDYADGKN